MQNKLKNSENNSITFPEICGTDAELAWIYSQNSKYDNNEYKICNVSIECDPLHWWASLIWNGKNSHYYDRISFFDCHDLVHFLNVVVHNRYRFKNQIHDEVVENHDVCNCFYVFLNNLVDKKIAIDNYFIKTHFLNKTTSDDWFAITDAVAKISEEIKDDENKRNILMTFFKERSKR